VRFEGPDSLPSTFAVTAFASAAIGAAALAVSELVAVVADALPVIVDRRLALSIGDHARYQAPLAGNQKDIILLQIVIVCGYFDCPLGIA
jgi:hypothetical protein